MSGPERGGPPLHRPAGSGQGRRRGLYLRMPRYRIFISCPRALPPFVKQELIALGYPAVSETLSGVETSGTLHDAMRMNLHLRTGHRVLLLLREFRAKIADELYRAAAAIEWEDIIDENGYVCVTSSVDTPSIRDTRFASLTCKDAIVDRIKRSRGRRPDSGPGRDRTVVHLYWNGERGSLYLDTSGESLARRGYRKIPLDAPLQETLAAAVVLAANRGGGENFVNPMCGSGTLAIEAALIGLRRAPGLLRSNFGFMHVKGFDAARWNALREEAGKEALPALPARIIATDQSDEAVRSARKNAAAAGVGSFIEFSVSDYAATPLPAGGGAIVLNPPYGARMGEIDQLAGLYRGIGDFFKQRGQGFRGYVFTGNLELAKQVGLKAARRIPFFNSGIECRLLEYELYEGTRRPPRGKRPQEGDAA